MSVKTAFLTLAVLAALVAAACSNIANLLPTSSPAPAPAPVTPSPTPTPPTATPPPTAPPSGDVLGVRQTASGQIEVNYSNSGWQVATNLQTRTTPGGRREVFVGGLWWSLSEPTASVPPPAPPPPAPAPSAPPPAPPPAAPVDPKLQALRVYLLDLVNRDRVQNGGLSPVTLGTNTAAQVHADEMLRAKYLSHWELSGMKPYMRFTLAGGVNYEGENVASRDLLGGSPFGPAFGSNQEDVKKVLAELEVDLMNSPGHRKNILTPEHKKVNLGIAYDSQGNVRVAQQFEGDYVTFSVPPRLDGTILSLAGQTTLGTVNYIAVYYDPAPQPLTVEQLRTTPPYNGSYTIGMPDDNGGKILPPPPPGTQYIGLDREDVVASSFQKGQDGSFTVLANMGPILQRGKGVYTLLIWTDTAQGSVAITRYALFVQ